MLLNYLKRSVATFSESLMRQKTDNNVNLIISCKRNSPLFLRPINLVLTRTDGLSSRSLSDTEVSLLQKELNFAVTPTSIPSH